MEAPLERVRRGMHTKLLTILSGVELIKGAKDGIYWKHGRNLSFSISSLLQTFHEKQEPLCGVEDQVVSNLIWSDLSPPKELELSLALENKRVLLARMGAPASCCNKELWLRFIRVEKSMRKAKKNSGSKNGLEKACKSGYFTKKEECEAEKWSYSHRIGAKLDSLER
ncbi:hypothetical protein PIB30_057376 [Stylosanthes scabra]|uniref:Uncharacterized protein n=1 Tax=Stylosanthes scabra TaxID=79078 RepID=A0ABU6QLF6_9FABA|nr:hypothetical protein [Stylosanthes scabra]